MNNINEVSMVSGKGKYHTNNPKAQNSKDLLTIVWDEIKVLVDNPQHIHKDYAQWLIPSTLPSRVHKTQENKGVFYALWGDLDDVTTPNLSEVENRLINLISHGIDACNYEIYNSKGATLERQKARILLPLKNGINGKDWRLFQKIFNDKLDALGLIPDRSSEGCAQVCYLPNRGELYNSLSKRDYDNFDPYEAWAHELQAKKDELLKKEADLKAKQEQVLDRRSNLKLDSNVINGNNAEQFKQFLSLFNSAYTPHEWMTSQGYDQEGDTFRHPNSQSGSYSATVRVDDNGVLRVNSLSTNDPLDSNGEGAHDAFSVFTVLVHGGDKNKALKDAGDNLLTIDGLSFNKAWQIKYMSNKADQDAINSFDPLPNKEPFQLSKFSLRGYSAEMKLKMLEDCYVLDRIAILGQATVIYAKPNTGKTLLVIWMLIQSINKNAINGDRVHYVNADDDYKGLVYKISLAEKYGFEMMAPNHNGFKSDDLKDYMQQMINDETASGAVIILDTLKKFTDLMDKKKGSEFMAKAREFVSNGGTVIMLAHTNKNRNADGKAVFGGTSDIVDDCDCVFVLDEVSRDQDTKQVFFENIKSRGDVATELAFKYSIEEGKDYQYRLDSVKLANKDETTRAKEEQSYWKQREKDQFGIDAITETLQQGINAKTELVTTAHENSDISKNNLLKILARYQGQAKSFLDNRHLWHEITGEKNKKSYHLNSFKETTKEEYEHYKNAE